MSLKIINHLFWGIINFCLKWFEQLSQYPCTDVQYPVCGCVSRFFLEIVKWTSQFLHTWLTWVKSNQWQLWVYKWRDYQVICKWDWMVDWLVTTDWNYTSIKCGFTSNQYRVMISNCQNKCFVKIYWKQNHTNIKCKHVKLYTHGLKNMNALPKWVKSNNICEHKMSSYTKL